MTCLSLQSITAMDEIFDNQMLREIYLFAELDDSELERVRSGTRTRRLAAGQTLFEQQARAEHFFWLRRGQIKLYRLSRDGQEKVMGVVQPGQTFAEGVMFMDEPRYPVNADALQSSEVVAFSAGGFLDVLSSSFPACRRLLGRMVERTRRHLDEIEALTLQNARLRVVGYLLRLVPRDAHGSCRVTLPTRKVLIASQLSIQPETLSRTLRDLESKGLIEVAQQKVRIADVDALRATLI